MYKPILLLFMALTLITSSSTAQKQVNRKAYATTLKALLKHNVVEISVAEASKQLPTATFLDTRESEEYKVSHIPNAIWVGYNDFDINRIKNLDKASAIIMYCSVGKRSEDLTKKLNEAGYTNVTNLYGGIFEWVNQGHEVVNEDGPTKKVHAYSRLWGIWLDKGDKVYK